jgi:hypothetical protein
MVGWDIDPNDKKNRGWQPALPFWRPKVFRANSKPNEFVLNTSNHINSTDAATGSEIEDGVIIYVPARILGFLKETIDGRVWAVVHTCQSACRTHSLLTRRWQLSYHDNGKPIIRLVVATALACPVFIVEEEPGLRERKMNSDIVYEVSNRRLHWSKIFMNMAREGVHNFVPSKVTTDRTDRETVVDDGMEHSNPIPVNKVGKAGTKKTPHTQGTQMKKTTKRKEPPKKSKAPVAAKKRRKGNTRKKTTR